jgi:hypothetical protein
MRGAIPPLPNTPSPRGARLTHRENFTFLFFSHTNRTITAFTERDEGRKEGRKRERV